MHKSMSRLFIVLAGLMFLPAANADPTGWLSSIPYALSGEGIYKVVIVEIDGKPSEPGIQYAIAGGTHTIKVQLMLKTEWTLDQKEQPAVDHFRSMSLEVKPGKHYQIAARVDIDASAEALSDGTFWSPFVYRETDL